MNINCVICSDLFDPAAEVFVTKCGHMFHYTCLMNWLERSKTCPQCRNRVTETNIHRVYFNLANTDNSFTDIGTLVNKAENLQFQLNMKDKEYKIIKEKADEFKKQNIGLRQEISDLEHGQKTYESAIQALKDQISYFKNRAREVDRLTEEIIRLKGKISAMENMQKVVDGTKEQVYQILREENNVESLAIYAAMLKKSLIEADLKKNETQHSLKKALHKLSKHKRDYLSTEAKYSQLKRDYDHLKTNYDKEKNFLKEKITKLNQATTGDSLDSPNRSIMQIALESPVNYNRTPNQKQPVVRSPGEESEAQVENVASDTASDSPYLQVKYSGVAIDYTSFMKTKVTKSSGDSAKPGFSIFKPSGTKMENVKLSKGNADVAYNGLGGSSKNEVFPSPKPAPTSLKRRKPTSSTVSSQKFKKLAPPKTAKVIDSIDLCDSIL